jgi:hypothetical protein
MDFARQCPDIPEGLESIAGVDIPALHAEESSLSWKSTPQQYSWNGSDTSLAVSRPLFHTADVLLLSSTAFFHTADVLLLASAALQLEIL